MTSSSNLTKHTESRFQSLLSLTIVVIFLLILAGGIVRGTGSGMGCPDWPKCFGQWIPPTEVSQLPPNYQQIYGAKLKGEVEFNAVKTWIEYLNRLLGVLSGFLVFATLVASFPFLRKDKAVFLGSATAFLLVGANGWLGSRVVASELAHYMITLHLSMAILVVIALLFVYVRVNESHWRISTTQNSLTSRSLNALVFATMLLSLLQILLGTQVREALDEVMKRLGDDGRVDWIDSLDWRFYVHRSFSLVILALHVAVIIQLRKVTHNKQFNQIVRALIWLVIAEILTGAIMGYFAVPAAAQPIHLLLAVIIIGLQFVAWLLINPALSLPQQASRQANLQEI